METLILIKHAMPEIDTTVSPHEWKLGEAGRFGAATLASLLAPYAPTHMVTSVESKAYETGKIVARQLGIPVEQRPDLHEHVRSNVRFMGTDEFHRIVAEFFAKPDDLVFGLETANAAEARFGAAIDRLLSDYPVGSLAVATHGTVISLFVAERTGCDAYPLWSCLGLPSFVFLSRPNLRLLNVVEGVDPAEPVA